KPPRSAFLADPVPAAAACSAGVVINLVLSEFQFVVIVGIDQRRERTSHGGSFGVSLCVFLEQIVGIAGEARVNAAGGQAGTALQFRAELAEIDSKVGLDQIVFAQAGEVGNLFCNRSFLSGGELPALEERGRVIALRVFARFFNESREIGGAIF